MLRFLGVKFPKEYFVFKRILNRFGKFPRILHIRSSFAEKKQVKPTVNAYIVEQIIEISIAHSKEIVNTEAKCNNKLGKPLAKSYVLRYNN